MDVRAKGEGQMFLALLSYCFRSGSGAPSDRGERRASHLRTGAAGRPAVISDVPGPGQCPGPEDVCHQTTEAIREDRCLCQVKRVKVKNSALEDCI